MNEYTLKKIYPIGTRIRVNRYNVIAILKYKKFDSEVIIDLYHPDGSISAYGIDAFLDDINEKELEII